MSEIYRQHQVWNNKLVLRKVYDDIYNRMTKFIKPGLILEIGSGGINFNKNYKEVIYTDIQNVPWVDVVSDAHNLPFVKNIFTNILMIDVLHHLRSPVSFFEEASKVLEFGGRIVLVEPAITRISSFFYKHFHSEPVNMEVNAFDKNLTTTDPYDSNQALPTLLFKDLVRFEELINDFKVIYKKEFGFLTYPLSGGFRTWTLLPPFLYPVFLKVEKYLETYLARYVSFRMLVVLEKINVP